MELELLWPRSGIGPSSDSVHSTNYFFNIRFTVILPPLPRPRNSLPGLWNQNSIGLEDREGYGEEKGKACKYKLLVCWTNMESWRFQKVKQPINNTVCFSPVQLWIFLQLTILLWLLTGDGSTAMSIHTHGHARTRMTICQSDGETQAGRKSTTVMFPQVSVSYYQTQFQISLADADLCNTIKQNSLDWIILYFRILMR
jgi:hypothetical protein